MASFELTTSSDGHIKALHRAIIMASKITREALLEFTPDKMRLCARTDTLLIKFVFNKDFFSDYTCDSRHRCYINLKALLMPFKSNILTGDSQGGLRSYIKLTCLVEDRVHHNIVFKVGADPPAATLTYRLSINDLDPRRTAQLDAINRTIDYARVEIAPKQSKKERFLLSAFTEFASVINQVTIITSQSEVKFIGSIDPCTSTSNNSHTTAEFAHKRDDFSTFSVKEDVAVTMPLRCLKLFLSFVENNKIQSFPKYVFEGVGQPAHFIYETGLYRGHFVSSTSIEFIPENILPITTGANESFIADENVIHEEDNEEVGAYEEEDEPDNYDDVESDTSEFLDGNLDGLNPNNSVFGAESIRSEIRGSSLIDAERIIDWDKDPDEIERVQIQYSSDSEDDDEDY